MILIGLCFHDSEYIKMASSTIKDQETELLGITCGHIGEGSGYYKNFLLHSMTWKSLMSGLRPEVPFQEEFLQA